MATKPTPPQKEAKTRSVLSDQAKFLSYHYFWVVDALVIIAVLAAGYYFLLLTKYKEIYSGAQIVQAQADYESKSKYLAELRGVFKLYEGIKPADKDKINKIVDNTNDRAELMNEFNFIITSNFASAIVDPQPTDANFRLDAISDNKKTGDLRRKIMRSSINITGVSYESLMKMIRTMETNLRIMDISRIEYYPQREAALLEVLTYQAQ